MEALVERVPSWSQELTYRQRSISDLCIRVQIPKSRKLRVRIHTLIQQILKHGPAFEVAVLAHLSISDSRFNGKEGMARSGLEFLVIGNHSSEEDIRAHVYYRWRLYSLLNSENPYEWSTTPFLYYAPISHAPKGEDLALTSGFSRESKSRESKTKIWWIPPHLNTELDSESNYNGHWLSLEERTCLVFYLSECTPRRGDIARVVVFALDHVHAAQDIVDIVVASVGEPDAPGIRVYARLLCLLELVRQLPSTRYELGEEFARLKAGAVREFLDNDRNTWGKGKELEEEGKQPKEEGKQPKERKSLDKEREPKEKEEDKESKEREPSLHLKINDVIARIERVRQHGTDTTINNYDSVKVNSPLSCPTDGESVNSLDFPLF